MTKIIVEKLKLSLQESKLIDDDKCSPTIIPGRSGRRNTTGYFKILASVHWRGLENLLDDPKYWWSRGNSSNKEGLLIG